jgi:hypothetical protein
LGIISGYFCAFVSFNLASNTKVNFSTNIVVAGIILAITIVVWSTNIVDRLLQIDYLKESCSIFSVIFGIFALLVTIYLGKLGLYKVNESFSSRDLNN